MYSRIIKEGWEAPKGKPKMGPNQSPADSTETLLLRIGEIWEDRRLKEEWPQSLFFSETR